MFNIKNRIIFSSVFKLFGIRKNTIIVNHPMKVKSASTNIKSSLPI
jgi:hypothetical protein